MNINQNSMSTVRNTQTVSPLSPQDFSYKHKNLPLLANAFHPNKDPRKESFFEMLKNSSFPNFTIYSFIFLKMLLDILIYTFALLWQGNDHSKDLMALNQKALFEFGEKYPYYMKDKLQLYRFVSTLFLNANLIQLTVNILSLMVFGSYVEKLLGFVKTFLSYFVAGVAGVLLSTLFKNEPGVDASASTMGLLGIQFGNLIISWDLWDYPGSGRYQMLYIILFGGSVHIWMGANFQNIEGISYIGSFFLGMILSLTFIKGSDPEEEGSKTYTQVCCFTIIAIYFVIGFLIFFKFSHFNPV